MRYTKPIYEKEEVEVCDVILASVSVSDAGEATLGGVEGGKGIAEVPFDSIF